MGGVHVALGVVKIGLGFGMVVDSRVKWTGLYPVRGGGFGTGVAIFPIFAILYNLQ